MITGYASIKGAVEAIKQGASDYITKPFQKEEILLATEKVLEKRRLLDEINYLRSQLSEPVLVRQHGEPEPRHARDLRVDRACWRRTTRRC